MIGQVIANVEPTIICAERCRRHSQRGRWERENIRSKKRLTFFKISLEEVVTLIFLTNRKKA